MARQKRTEPLRIISHMVRLCEDIGVQVIGEGVETVGEYAALRDMGVLLQQGYLFARPSVGKASAPTFPD